MRFSTRINSLLGFAAGAILSLFGRSPAGSGADDLKRADFPASTQRMGIRFTEKIRDAFRGKWLKVTRRSPIRGDAPMEQSQRSGRIQ
jgi:hypothetical protein